MTNEEARQWFLKVYSEIKGQGYVDENEEAYELAIKALEQEPNRDMEEIAEIMKSDADAETKCKMISNILTAKPHYFAEQEPTDEWQNGYDMAWEEAEVFYEKEPCDKCVYSTKDGYCQYDDISETIPPLKPCDDVVSRQIISDYVESHVQEINTGYGDLNEHTNRILRMIMEYIDKLPFVRPQEQTGHWIKHEHGFWSWVNKNGERDGWIPDYECSECGSRAWEHKTNYCPQCGAWMFEPQESEDKK